MVYPANSTNLLEMTSRRIWECVMGNLPVGSKNLVPEHCVLSIVRLRNTMVDIVGLGVEDHDAKGGKFNIEAGMIPSSKDASNTKEKNCRKRVDLKVEIATAKVHREQMIVLSQKELQWVNINGVMVGTTAQWKDK